MLVVAVPTNNGRRGWALTLAELDDHLLPALLLDIAASQHLIKQTLTAVDGNHIVVGTGDGHELHLYHGDRHWHGDDGVIDAEDRRQQAIVSNLPAGSVYTTVIRNSTRQPLSAERAGNDPCCAAFYSRTH